MKGANFDTNTSACSPLRKTKQRLRALLDEDLAEGRIATARDNKIHRVHYARQLGVTPSALQAHRSVLEEYERKAELVSGPLADLEAMRKWLTSQYGARTLTLRDRKIDRKSFAAQFGLRGGTFMTRHAQIRELIEEFDARAARDDYLPISLQPSVDRVREALRGEPELNSDRMTINLVVVAKAAGISVNKLGHWPYAELVNKRQSEVMQQVKASKIDPYLHGRVFPFSGLLAIWPMRFLERVAVRFKQIASGRSDTWAKKPYLQLVAMLKWVGTSANLHCSRALYEAREHGRIISADFWEEAVFAYRTTLVERIARGLATKQGVDSDIKALRAGLVGISSAKLVPVLSVPLPGVKHARQAGSKRQSVAEVVKTSASGASDYVAFAHTQLVSACKASGVDLSSGEAKQFLSVLSMEIEARPTLPADVALAIKLLLERRLNLLRARAVAIVDAATSAYRRGRGLIALARLDTEAFEEKYFGGSLNGFDRKRLLNDSFPAATDIADADISLANFLLYLDRQHGGIPPSANSETQNKYGQFFSKRYLTYGGLQTIAPLLHPNAEAVGAVLTLYLIESGSNISVGRTLAHGCLEPSDVEGHRRITGMKARAQGKPIIVDLPDTSPAVLSIEWLAETGQAVRAKSGPDADRLFVARIDSRNQLLTSHWYTNHFKRFVASIDELRDLPLLPSMIRPTVLLEAALSNDGRLRLGLAFGQHSEHVGQGYQQKWPTRLLYDENIRRFNSEFETLILSSIDESARNLRVDAGEYARRLENLQNTGLGTFCKGRGVRPNRDGSRCQIDCWNECPNLVLLAEINAFAILQLWQASLRAAQPHWERDRPERWDEVWLPWLCFTDVVEEKASRGPLLKIWRAAQKRAAEMTADQGYVPPRPW